MPRLYFAPAAKIASGADFLFPETTGTKPAGTDLLNRYSIRIQRSAMHSTEVRRTFTSVQHLIRPMSRLMAPRCLPARTCACSNRSGSWSAGHRRLSAPGHTATSTSNNDPIDLTSQLNECTDELQEA